MDERDIYRAAKLRIDRYGTDASDYAAMCVDFLIEASDVQVVAVSIGLSPKARTRHAAETA